jgi:UDP-2-acetamido-3-amino-2,3-dideoxy-glucuronate N-acetyltransferase
MSIVHIHPKALVATTNLGEGTRVWAFTNILPGARIGRDCNICDHCFVENDVLIGDRVTLKCGVFVWDGVTIEDDVFIGPAVVFTNDRSPRSKRYLPIVKTHIAKGASIGANATILPGLHIGSYSMVGAGSVVTKNVLAYALVFGNPARQHGWVDEDGEQLTKHTETLWKSNNGTMYEVGPAGLSPNRRS